MWCSDPVEGKAIHPREWVQRLHAMEADGLEARLRRIRAALLTSERAVCWKNLPYALTIIALGEVPPAA
jgi:hypothetical protein